jgi:hypothetical protein
VLFSVILMDGSGPIMALLDGDDPSRPLTARTRTSSGCGKSEWPLFGRQFFSGAVERRLCDRLWASHKVIQSTGNTDR